MQSLFTHILQQPMTWIMFVFGALVGSFLNVCILRIPEKTFFKSARSRCRHCDALIPAYLNVPILAWIFLRGSTRCCGKPLAWQYPAVELTMAILMVINYWHLPFFKSETLQFDAAQILRFGHFTIFTALLLVCSVIDLRLRIIPDVISLPMIAVVPILVWLHPDLDWQSALFGVLAGGASLYLVAWLYYVLRKQAGIGMGDVKLLAAIGGWLGYQAILPTILMASVTGTILGIGLMVATRKVHLKTALPFGPFLAFGAYVHFLWGERIAEALATFD